MSLRGPPGLDLAFFVAQSKSKKKTCYGPFLILCEGVLHAMAGNMGPALLAPFTYCHVPHTQGLQVMVA